MKRVRQGIILLVVALLWLGWLLTPGRAQAHARLMGSSPASGSSLQDAPAQIDISFSESVSLDFSAIRLLDRTRQELPLGQIGYGPQGETSVRVPVTGSLPPGTYGVVWRVVSAVDGHLNAGSFVFRVLGAGENPQATPEPVLGGEGTTEAPIVNGSERPDALHWLVRALVLVCITFCLGGAIFLVLVVEPAAGELGQAGASLWPILGARFARFGGIAAAALVPLLATDLWAQVAAIAQTDLLGALARADLGSLLLSTTRYGFAWAMKMLAAVGLFGLFLFVSLRRRSGEGLWEIAIAAGSLFLLAESLSSHAAAAQGGSVAGLPLPVISDWVHLVTASTWIGGLLFFLAVLFPAYRRMKLARDELRAFLAVAVPRFSRLALASVFALGVSGTYNLAIQTTDLPAIASSLYGQVVALKVIIFLALIAIGAINLTLLSPRLRVAALPGNASTGGTGTVAHFRRNVRLEVALVLVVLLCAGGLTLLPPPSNANPQDVSQTEGGLTLPTTPATAALPTSVALTPPAVVATTVARTSVSLAIEQADASEVLSVTLAPEIGGSDPFTDVTKVDLTISPQGIEAGSTVLVTESVSPAQDGAQVWVASGSVLAFEGSYLVSAVAQRTNSADLKAAFWLTLAEGGSISLRAIEYVEARISTVPEPPIVGSTQVVVALRGPEGEPIDGAGVILSALGPEGRRIEANDTLAPVAGEPGDYGAQVDFPVAGGWSLEVLVSRTGQSDLRLIASLDVLAK